MRKWSTLSILFIAASLGFFFGIDISFQVQWPYFEALRTTSSMIFAIMGVWFAIIYPEIMRNFFTGNTFNEDEQIDEKTHSDIQKLLNPIIHATSIVVILLIIGVIFPLLPECAYVNGLSYSILVALTFFQIYSLLASLVPVNRIFVNIKRKLSRDKMIKTEFPRAKKHNQRK